MYMWMCVHVSLPPDHGLAAAQLVDQEGQHRGLVGGRVRLEGLGLQAEDQSWLLPVGLHEDLQDLRHVVPRQAHVGQVVPQRRLGLDGVNGVWGEQSINNVLTNNICE